jgi:glycosyltransferase involved in cell wall biosynthesis
MRILLLGQGPAEDLHTWSGVTSHLVRHLRESGHEVLSGDVEPAGWSRYAAALGTWSPHRRRWWVRYQLGSLPFRLRSAAAERILNRVEGRFDAVLQTGATFRARVPDGVPLVLYCDSNIALSRSGADTGQSEAAYLTPSEARDVEAREAEVYGAAALIFTMSHRVRDSFISDFGIPAERLQTIHCGANVSVPELELAPAGNGPRPGFQGDAGGGAGGDHAPVILFVGRDFERKGGGLLLEAFRAVRDAIPGARLHFVGGRPTGRIAIPEGVRFLGYLDRGSPEGAAAMDRAYRDASLFCLPTRFEPFGTSFVEAMLYGLPCVGPRRWAVPEIIVDGETGSLVPPENPEALARALVRLLSDPRGLHLMGAAARARAIEHFTWPGVVSRMLARLEPLVDGAAR